MIWYKEKQSLIAYGKHRISNPIHKHGTQNQLREKECKEQKEKKIPSV